MLAKVVVEMHIGSLTYKLIKKKLIKNV